MRRPIFLPALIVLSFFLYLCTRTASKEHLRLNVSSIQLRHALLRQWLRRDHHFQPANHENIKLKGRWTLSKSRVGAGAGFPGASAHFDIHNSTALFIDLQETSPRLTSYGLLKSHSGRTPLNFVKRDTQQANPASISVLVGNETLLFRDVAHGILDISRDLAINETYRVTIILLKSQPMQDSVLHFQGIWLSKGGKIITKGTIQADHDRTTQPAIHTESLRRQDHSVQWHSRNVIEVIAPSSTVSQDASLLSFHNSSHHKTYPELLERSNLFNTTVVTLPLSHELCLLPNCQPKQISDRKPHAPTIRDLYFRSGPITTSLYHRLWAWSSSSNPPTHLIFDIGLQDFVTFFTSSQQPPAIPALATFTTHFTTAYVNFINTIRRTTWHPQTPDQDMTYAFDSAPSPLTIFILVPTLPPTTTPFTRALMTAMHKALSNTITQLRKTTGDKSTVLIDTSGWLDDSDFSPATTTTTTTTTTTRTPQPNFIPALNAKGHLKMSHFLSLHLCPHLADDPETTCPFGKPTEYVGNLYVPTEVAVGRVLQERKIDRVKALVEGRGCGEDDKEEEKKGVKIGTDVNLDGLL